MTHFLLRCLYFPMIIPIKVPIKAYDKGSINHPLKRKVKAHASPDFALNISQISWPPKNPVNSPLPPPNGKIYKNKPKIKPITNPLCQYFNLSHFLPIFGLTNFKVNKTFVEYEV